MDQNYSTRRGFTLVELLVVIAIIGILVALLLPAVQSVREAARRTQCINQQKQCAQAIQNYHSARDKLPPARLENHHATWLFVILPYMEQQAVYDAWPLDKDYYDMPAAFHESTVPGIMCPSQSHESLLMKKPPDNVHGHSKVDIAGAITDYMPTVGSTCRGLNYDGDNGNPGLDDLDGTLVYGDYPGFPGYPQSLTKWSSRTSLSKVTDGTSNTLMIAESTKSSSLRRHAFCGDHGAGTLLGEQAPFLLDDDVVNFGFGSSHPGVVVACMADGSTQALSKEIDAKVLDRMVTRAGNDVYTINGSVPTCSPTAGGVR